MAFEVAFGWGWLVQLLEDYGFEAHLVHPLRCKAIASDMLKNDKAGAAILAQLLRADLLPEAWIAPPQVRQLRALPRRTGPARSASAASSGTGSTRSPPTVAMTAVPATGPGPGAAGWPSCGPRHRLPGGHRRPGPGDRPDRRRAARPCQGRPSEDTPDAAWLRGVHRAGDAGRDRRHQPVRNRLTWTDGVAPPPLVSVSGVVDSPNRLMPGSGYNGEAAHDPRQRILAFFSAHLVPARDRRLRRRDPSG